MPIGTWFKQTLSNIGGFIGGLWGSVKATLGRIFGSRKVMLGVIALALTIVTYLAPELKDQAGNIAQMIWLGTGFVIANVTIEDSVTKWAARPQTADEALKVIQQGFSGSTGQTITATLDGGAKLPNG